MSDLDVKVDKEYADIQALENEPIIIVFGVVLGDREERFEKERQDYLQAVLEYGECKKVISVLEFEIDVLQRQQIKANIIMQDIERKILQFHPTETSSNVDAILRFKDLISNLRSIVKYRVEIDEALHVAEQIEKTLLQLNNKVVKVQKSKSWTQKQTYAEIQKQKHQIDIAQEDVIFARKQFLILHSELNDVKKIHHHFKQSQVLRRGFNINYYTMLISDWVHDKNLLETKATTTNLV